MEDAADAILLKIIRKTLCSTTRSTHHNSGTINLHANAHIDAKVKPGRLVLFTSLDGR